MLGLLLPMLYFRLLTLQHFLKLCLSKNKLVLVKKNLFQFKTNKVLWLPVFLINLKQRRSTQNKVRRNIFGCQRAWSAFKHGWTLTNSIFVLCSFLCVFGTFACCLLMSNLSNFSVESSRKKVRNTNKIRKLKCCKSLSFFVA